MDQQPPSPAFTHQTITCDHSAPVTVDLDDILPQGEKQQFEVLHTEFEDVFDPQFKGYNGAVGPFKAVVNMGPVQPPQPYGRDAFPCIPETSSLICKPSLMNWKLLACLLDQRMLVLQSNMPTWIPLSWWRSLVEIFALWLHLLMLVGIPSLNLHCLFMPHVDSTLRKIDQWKYIIASELMPGHCICWCWSVFQASTITVYSCLMLTLPYARLTNGNISLLLNLQTPSIRFPCPVINEVLWCCHPLPWSTCVLSHKSHGNARVKLATARVMTCTMTETLPLRYSPLGPCPQCTELLWAPPLCIENYNLSKDYQHTWLDIVSGYAPG